ncbi:hypothetical protein FGRMN_2759 [Fusarium graminum]|nr:hypothetical protein FGRMN_2759 [Fusarium graminum]
MPLSEPGVNSRNDAPFEYIPLGRRQFRLLQLNPAGEEKGDLSGILLIKSLDDLPPRIRPGHINEAEPINPEKHVCFEAISYVWGEATFTDAFHTPQGSIPITTSLGSILRRLRDATVSRLYWADGICINQSDVAEKEIQVSLMGTIYSSAVRVLCDIGEETETVSLTLDAMTRYWKRNIRHGYMMGDDEGTILSGEATAKVMGLQLPTDEEADALEDVEGEEWPGRFVELISRPWLHRLWVVQEFVLGRDVTMVFGRRHISWGELWAGTVWYSGVQWPWDSADFISNQLTTFLMSYNSMCLVRTCRTVDLNTHHGREFARLINILLCGVEFNRANLSICLILFSSHGCTVARDRYFGILGMVDEDERKDSLDLRPDYTSSMRDITTRFWRHALRYNAGGELILLAGTPGRVQGWPSWLRDITAVNPLSHVWIGAPLSTAWHQAGGPSDLWSAVFRDDDLDCLFTKGYHIDTISQHPSLSARPAFERNSMFNWLNEAFILYTAGLKTLDCDADMRYSLTGEHIHEAVLKSVCDYNKSDTTPSGANKFEAILRMGLSVPLVAPSDTTEAQDLEDKVLAAFSSDLTTLEGLYTRIYAEREMCFCKTEKGLVTLFHKDTRPGDSIWILKGCRLPVVLRPCASHPGTFEFVGGGYVHGLMNGEIFSRPGFKWKGVCLRSVIIDYVLHKTIYALDPVKQPSKSTSTL